MVQNFKNVTEIAGEKVSQAQLCRVVQRYVWAGGYCHNKDVLEIACGVGQGLGYLASVSRSIRAGDITPDLVLQARAHYGNRISITEMDAEHLPFDDSSLDVVILFEAIYYLPSAKQFIQECKRVLRPGGVVLIATANKDLFDFNPSPYSTHYYGVVELNALLQSLGFSCVFLGNLSETALGLKQKIIRLIKKLVVALNLMPKTMSGKKWLKRIFFGELLPMPAEIDIHTAPYVPPVAISSHEPSRCSNVLYVAATKV
ncbi:class I SAM-dependent methyltransferase [bacterium]|nr:class I SAM-dependent methyltransferase [bacterium]